MRGVHPIAKRVAWGAVVAGLAVSAAPVSLRADPVVTPLHAFDGSGDEGGAPAAALAVGGDGNLYGTTSAHGTGVTDPAGTVFRVSTTGSFESLYTFDFQVTGDTPLAGVLPSGGDVYGTTRGSGAYQGNVFRIDSQGGFHELHAFSGYLYGPDGAHPQSDLVGDGSGNLYGTTYNGGENDVGTVFRIAANGDYKLLHSFRGRLDPADGFYPLAGLTDGGDGNFYGTTNGGGPSGSLGTVFRVTPAGDATMLHEFLHLEDGGYPASRLVLGREDGRLYGTTTAGGMHGNGTVFRISTSGDFATLYSLDNSNGDGYTPNGLVEGSDGNFYGTTYTGGVNSFGTVFGVSPTGRFKALYSFPFLGSGGYTPRAALVQGDGDVFYGTTSSGALSGCGGGCGVVFEIKGLIAAPEPDTALAYGTTALALGLLARRGRPRRSQGGESMQTSVRVAAGVAVLGLLLHAGDARAASASEINHGATAALESLYADSPGARALADKAKAILVFPEIVKGGFIIAGQYGDGVLRKGGKPVAYYRSLAASYGLQAGVQSFGYALFFLDDQSLSYLNKSRGWELGTGPSLVIVDEGFAKNLSTTTLQKGVYAFIFDQKGLMAGIGLQGTKITRIHPGR